MEFRYLIESIFCGIITFVFQYYITGFNRYLHKSRKEALIIVAYIEAGRSEHHIEKHRERLHEDLKEASHELYEAMIISFVNLMFPIKLILSKYFLNKTGRNASIFGVLTLIEFALFVLCLMWINDYYRF